MPMATGIMIEMIGCYDVAANSFQPIPLQEVILRKLQQLPAEAPRLLDLISVAGHAVSIEEVSKAAGHDQLAIATLGSMRIE